MLIPADQIKPIHYEKARELIEEELQLAIKKHPYWPDDFLHGLAVIQEELGETFKACVDHTYFGGRNLEQIRHELAQTGCTVIRMLAYIERVNDGL